MQMRTTRWLTVLNEEEESEEEYVEDGDIEDEFQTIA